MLNKIRAALAHRGFIRYFKNTSWMLGEQVLRIVSSLFIGIWVARYLGPDKFGILSYILAFTAIFSIIANLGLDDIIVRELIKHPEKDNTYLGTIFWLKVVGAIMVIGIISIAIQFTSNDEDVNQFIFIISISSVFQSFGVIAFYFQAQVLAKFISICKITQLILSSFVKIYLVLAESELIWFVLAALFDTIMLSVALCVAYQIHGKPGFYKYFDFNVAKYLLKDSWPLILSGIVIMIYMRIDQIMIREMLGEYEVGIYSVAVRLSEAWYFIPMIIANSLFPAILKYKQVGKEIYYQRLQRLYTLMVWLAIAIALPVTFLGNSIVNYLYGEIYYGAGKILIVYIWASIFIFLGVASAQWLIAENFVYFAFLRNAFGAIVNIIMNLILIKKYGAIGAAYATVLATLSAFLICDLFRKETRCMFLMKINSLKFK